MYDETLPQKCTGNKCFAIDGRYSNVNFQLYDKDGDWVRYNWNNNYQENGFNNTYSFQSVIWSERDLAGRTNFTVGVDSSETVFWSDLNYGYHYYENFYADDSD